RRGSLCRRGDGRLHRRASRLGEDRSSPPQQAHLDGPVGPLGARKSVAARGRRREVPICGSSLIFDAVYVGHDGVYRCPQGHFERPTPELAATDIELVGFDALALTIEGTRIAMPLGGLYNCYNVLAAFAVARSIGLEASYVADRLRSFKAAFGRQERIDFRGRH